MKTPSTEAGSLREPDEKIAPVQGWPQGIPWSLHLEAYAAYCKKWSPQPAMIDLEGRGCRGGFHVDELDEFIPGWREKVSEIGKLKAEVERLRAALSAASPLPAEPIAWLWRKGPDRFLSVCETVPLPINAFPVYTAESADRTAAPNDSDTERARFERWAAGRGMKLPRDRQQPNDYAFAHAKNAWQGWQAAMKEQP